MARGRLRWSPAAAVSGCLLVLSGLLPWVSSGPGSTFRGVELASALINSRIMPDGARWAGVVVLLVAMIGVAHLASLAWVNRAAEWFRGLSGGVVLLLVTSIAAKFGVSTWGAGLWCAAVGSAVAVGATVATMVLRNVGLTMPTKIG